jgi:hypothetical protein
MEDKIKCYIYPPHVCSFICNFQLTGSTSWVEAVISTIQEKCRTEIENDENQWVDTNGTPSLPANVVNNVCLNDCSGQGSCTDGK